MKKNNERIARYLSELMDAEELTAFKNELENSKSLKEELDSFTSSLEEMKLQNFDVDERYFANLVPKVRSKMEKTSIFNKIPKYAFAASTLAVIVMIGLFTFKTERTRSITYGQLVQEIVKNLDDERVSQKYITELELDMYHTYDTDIDNAATNEPIVVDDAAKQKILVAYDTPINEEIITSQKLSEDELKNIFKSIESEISH